MKLVIRIVGTVGVQGRICVWLVWMKMLISIIVLRVNNTTLMVLTHYVALAMLPASVASAPNLLTA